MRTTRSVLLATAMVGLALVAPAAPAVAVPTPSDPIAEGLAGPLQFELGENGQVYVAQAFAGLLTKVRADGTTKTLVSEPGEIAGVTAQGYTVTYTFTGGTEEEPVALLKQRRPNGHVRTIADLGEFEAQENPDAFARYGLRNVSASCLEDVPPDFHPYGGIVESHPYAVATDPHGGWYVADAAANAVLHVDPDGDIEVVKVPRPAKITITQEIADAVGFPDCVVGKPFAFEPVPTDVEVNARGYLIVSLLPGGPEPGTPEGDLLGPRGMVMRISPGDFEWTILARGLSAATNVAPAPGGRIYISELAGNRVSVLRNGTVTPVLDLPAPAAVEFENGRLFASTDVFGNGSIVRILGLGS
jgi:DNA-binding beta-propeller fold protein YncE